MVPRTLWSQTGEQGYIIQRSRSMDWGLCLVFLSSYWGSDWESRLLSVEINFKTQTKTTNTQKVIIAKDKNYFTKFYLYFVCSLPLFFQPFVSSLFPFLFLHFLIPFIFLFYSLKTSMVYLFIYLSYLALPLH